MCFFGCNRFCRRCPFDCDPCRFCDRDRDRDRDSGRDRDRDRGCDRFFDFASGAALGSAFPELPVFPSRQPPVYVSYPSFTAGRAATAAADEALFGDRDRGDRFPGCR